MRLASWCEVYNIISFGYWCYSGLDPSQLAACGPQALNHYSASNLHVVLEPMQ